jgi:hypothetical protein
VSGTVDKLAGRRVLMVVSNLGASAQTGWPVGSWLAELTHADREFPEHGYQVAIASPDGGALKADPWSGPRGDSGGAGSQMTLASTAGIVHLSSGRPTRARGSSPAGA